MLGPVTPTYLCILIRVVVSILIKVATNHQILATYTRAYWLGLLFFRICSKCWVCLFPIKIGSAATPPWETKKIPPNASRELMILFTARDATTTRMNYWSPFLSCRWEDMVVILHCMAATLRSQTCPLVPPIMQLVAIKRRCKSFGYDWPSSQFATCYDQELL
jgi:hypothetical protein